MKYRITQTDQPGIVDIEPVERDEAAVLHERLDDQRHKMAEQDAMLGRVLMRLDALEKREAK